MQKTANASKIFKKSAKIQNLQWKLLPKGWKLVGTPAIITGTASQATSEGQLVLYHEQVPVKTLELVGTPYPFPHTEGLFAVRLDLGPRSLIVGGLYLRPGLGATGTNLYRLYSVEVLRNSYDIPLLIYC